MVMFDYDWWHGPLLAKQQEEAKRRCTVKTFPDVDPATAEPDSEFATFLAELETRIIICLRDGLHYEVRELVDVGSSSYLTAECVPGDDAQQDLAPVIAVPFDEIVRVEVIAFHPSKRPGEGPHITGFRGGPDGLPLGD